eukprot:CAMPEP_0115677466 /NCGR_PEP_ID=MMETSP0272-20121206/55236_1 /TAXON_ID=71861 /ORGANISM="Scrippsiella trochoidea, Strain CCMP3099" /LENGTH=54 /DNA_ID=CAMNT_0003116577 /DNA_START=26 /DNA_END=186 /DNA_ORIENTATION=+
MCDCEKAPVVQTTIKVAADSGNSMSGPNTSGALVAACEVLLLSKWAKMWAAVTA